MHAQQGSWATENNSPGMQRPASMDSTRDELAPNRSKAVQRTHAWLHGEMSRRILYNSSSINRDLHAIARRLADHWLRIQSRFIASQPSSQLQDAFQTALESQPAAMKVRAGGCGVHAHCMCACAARTSGDALPRMHQCIAPTRTCMHGAAAIASPIGHTRLPAYPSLTSDRVPTWFAHAPPRSSSPAPAAARAA